MMTAMMQEPMAVAIGWDHEAVEAFVRGREDILVVPRPALAGLEEAVEGGRVQSVRALVGLEDVGVQAREALALLNIDCVPLALDIVGLVCCFLRDFGPERASLRVELVEKANCPKFHCDNVHVRLIVTYAGPGTEYVRQEDPETVEIAPPFALVFLKGHKHATHADTVHHRSPALPAGGKRLCAVIDF